jgi:hypothetical protein
MAGKPRRRRGVPIALALTCAASISLAACSASTSTDGSRGSVRSGSSFQLSPSVQQQRPQKDGSPVDELAGVQFVTRRDGFLLDCVTHSCRPADLLVLRTRDAGSSWRTMGVAPSRTVSFISGTVGFALKTGCDRCPARVLRTKDGGRSWRRAGTVGAGGGAGSPQRQLDFVDATSGWLAYSGRLFRTTDGGSRWTSRPSIALGVRRCRASAS